VCVVISVAFMFLDHRFKALNDIRDVVSVALYPVQYVVNFPVSAGAWIDESFSTRETMQNELISLKTRQILYDARLQKLAVLETENRRLRQLLESSRKVNEKVLIAELLSVDLEPFTSQVVINKGTRHKIYEGQPLLDANGIMGQITRVNPLTSTAMLITDPNHAIPVAVNRNNLRAVALGTGSKKELDLPHFPNNADIEVGDLLVSTGLGGRFPGGYPVATITSIKLDPGQSFARVTAAPTAQLQRSREVLLVWPNFPGKNQTTKNKPTQEAKQ